MQAKTTFLGVASFRGRDYGYPKNQLRGKGYEEGADQATNDIILLGI